MGLDQKTLSASASPGQQKALRQRLRRLIRDATEVDAPEPDGADNSHAFWDLEPKPVVINSDEWSLISEALHQRAKLTNALLSDIYTSQAILHERQIPPELVLGDPRYRRPCLNLEPERSHLSTLLRFDLTRSSLGWTITATHTNTPIGLSYAVQNRRFISQESAQAYAGLPDFHGVVNFPLQLLDSLRRLSPRGAEDASIVLLTSGPQDRFFSEHSFLARKMGIPLARGDDLLVLDNCVYMKTIAGLERIDVIYRRLDDAQIDPVVFSTPNEGAGVPGLIQSIREKKVVVTNAIGSGLAESRAFDGFLSTLTRFYLGEKAVLPAIPTYMLDDPERIEAAVSEHGELTLRDAHTNRGSGSALPAPREIAVRSLRDIPADVVAAPWRFVLQAIPSVKTGRSSSSSDLPLTISAFVLSKGDGYTVFPGGYVQVEAPKPGQQRLGRLADLVILRGAGSPGSDPGLPVQQAPQPQARKALGSRSAENLYWLGRYLERSESTARMLSIIDDVAMEELPARDRVRWLPIWRGLLEATGHTGERLSARAPPQFGLATDLTWRMLLDRSHPSSIFSSVDMARENARLLRDCISPEVWTLLNQLQDTLREAHQAVIANNADTDARELAARSTVDEVLLGVNALLGTAERTMLQDASWQFVQIGMHLERAIMTCSALRHTLAALVAQAVATPDVADYQNPELSALVRMLGSQDAYRRLFQTVSTPRLVTDLFLKQKTAPRSILHNLDCIVECLGTIREEINERGDWGPTTGFGDVQELIEFLHKTEFNTDFETQEKRATAKLPAQLADLLKRLHLLHTRLNDHYFSHQARI